MGVYDKTLRELFQDVPYKLIQLLTNQKITKVLDSHFPQVEEREADLVVELENGDIFHLEIQSVNDTYMPKRMLYYYLLIDKVYKKAPIQMVLYVGEKNNTIKNGLDLPNLKYIYKVVNIKDIDCKELVNSKSINDNIIAILCNIENPNQFFEKINQKLLNLNNKQRENYLRKLIILARLRPKIYENLENFYKEKKMPFIIEAKNDPLYHKGWNEAWNEAWGEAWGEAWNESWDKSAQERKIKDAIIMIKEFNIPIEKIAEKFEIDENILIEKLKENIENRN